ncbi:MAG: CxxxxCH/CxxCH domain-containing protein [Deltaproteobacteria bacterium]|nr:MAG: CxxxxCH/CxxCH domain-containing protein [Deltaproteobacteria bacterium]
MGDRARFRQVHFIQLLLLFLVFLGWPPGADAAHDLSQDCYNCHNIETGQVWAGSYSIWSGKAIGMSPYSRPVTCDICHSDYGNRFKSTSESHHPVSTIGVGAMVPDYDNGVRIDCRDCHNGNSVTTLTPNLIPDLAPTDYLSTAGNTATDGYPNHDVLSPNNQVVPGDNAHLLSMLLSAGQRTVSGSSVYNKVPSANPATDYAFCFACHDGSANTARAVNVRQDYIDKGHYFKATGGGITAGDRIPCSDCHASHNSATNARLFEPDNTTWTGTRPSGLTFASPYAPTDAEYRTVCIFCHEDYNSTDSVLTAKRVRGVAPAPRKWGVTGHASSDTQSCKQCHNPHKTPGGGPDCLTCHTAGGPAGTAYDYIDALFKGVGSDNTATQPASVGSLAWSQHGGFVSAGGAARFLYTSPYNTKAVNDCFKCHGDRHNNTYALIDADTGGSDTYAYDPAVGMNDNSAAGITNANAFCLTCHDGNGAAADVQIGNVAPPNVATNYAGGGHGRPQASGAYTVSLNNPAYLKCTDCHEVHGSNHAKLLPAKKNEITANFTIPSNFTEKTFRSGGSTLLARDVDFTDYSSPASGKGFGTTGDPGDQHAPAGATTGFCDACHRFAGRANRGTDNVTDKAHTHEGIVGDANQSSPSQMTFTKDCLECHDTHGTTNLEMVRTSINGVTPIVFTARTGAGSFDPVEGGSTANANSVCTACHQNSTENPALNVDHNFRTSTVNPDHNEDTNCAACHAHGTAADAKKFGFPQAACNSCHGASSDTAGMPATGDTGTYHTDANNVIGTRAGDNTAHKVHVNYLVNRRGVAAASTCYVCHKGGGAQETGHPGNPTNTTFKSGSQPTAVPYVQIALDNTGAVLNVWNGAGTGPAYSGTPGLGAGPTNGWKTCSNTNCHYALSPSWSGMQQAPAGVMTVSTPDALPAAGSVLAGSANNVVDKIRMQTDASGMVTDNQIKVRLKAGSTAQNGTDIAKVAFWDDADNDNTVSAGDVQIGGSAVFSGTDNGYTVTGISFSVAASTTKQVLVAVDLAAGAVNGRTMTFSTLNGDIKASYGTISAWTTFDSNLFTVSAPGTLTVSTPDALPAAGPVMVGSGNNVADKINLVAGGGYATVTGLKVKELGTAQDVSDISGITFWRDVNSNGTLETGTDTILGGAATFSAADNTYAVTGLSLTVSSGATERILVVDNVAAGAVTSRTIQTQVVDATYVTLSAGTVAGTFPIAASSVQTISSGGQLTVTTPDALPAAGDIRGASDNNVVDKITLTAATANVTVSGLWVKELGSSVDGSDIASVTFVDNTAGAGALLGASTFNAADNTYRLTGLGLTVAVGTPRTILVMANVANGATAARTVQTQVNDGYVQVSTGTVNPISSFSSTIQTIRALTGLVVTDTAGSTTPVTTTSLSASGTHQFYATATYSSAALNQNVTTASAWSRAGTATGSTVGASTGLYTAGSTAGSDNVTATYRGQSDDTTVSVTTAVAFPATTYYGTNNSGTSLGWATTNAPTAANPHNNVFNIWTLAVKSGQSSAFDSYGATNTSYHVAWRQVYNTAIASGSALTITGVEFRIYNRKVNANDRVRLILNYYDASGTPTVIYDSQLLDTGTGINSIAQFIHTSPALAVSVPDGMKLGMEVGFQQGSTTTYRVYLTRSTTTQNAQFIITGTSASGTAPAPPRTTGGGTAIACNTCHQFGPDDATAGYKDSSQYYYALPGSHAKHGVSLIAGTDPVADNAVDTCTACHLTGTGAFGSDHMDGTVDMRSGSIGTRTAGPAYADDGTYADASRTCSNVYCHAGRTTPQATGQSWGYGSSTCGVCHAVTPPFGKHAIHNNGNASTTPTETSTAGNYDFSCYYCHPSGAEHVNYPVSAVQAAQVSFSGTLGGQTLGGTYTPGLATAGWDNVTNQGLSWTNGSCATYCHTNGQGGAALVTPTWNHSGFPTATCVGCHDTRGVATTLSTRHRKHTDSTAATGYDFTCDECHAATVANDSRTTLHATTGRPNHVDGNLTVQFGTTLRATSVAISGTYAQGVDNCANTYCHSDGSSIKNGGTIQANSIRWDNTTTPLPCNSCHGVGGPASGAPNYTTSGTRRNSHSAHASVTCQTCHSQTTTTGNTITTAANHVNGTYQVSGTGFTYSDANMLTTGSTCAFTSGCHTGTVTWGTPLTGGCFACHTGAEVANKPLETVDGVPNPVDNTQYNGNGHGNSTTFAWDGIAGPAFLYSYTGSPNNGCYECHSSGASHVPKSATDPYRLGAWATNVDGLCNDCHGPSAANPRKAVAALNLGILGHNKVNTGSARTWPGNYDYKCVDCHDPHGDGNYYMVRSAVNNPTTSTDTNAGSNAYGTPKDTALSPITFTSLAGFAANSYAVSGAADGICEVCHNQTTLFNATGSDNAGTHASRTGRCTACHKHDTGFKGSGDCEACHNGAQGPRRAITAEFGYTSHHSQGVTASTVTKITCSQCHMEANSDGSMSTTYHNNGGSSPYPVDLVVYTTYPTRGTPVSITNLAQADLTPASAHCRSCHNAANQAATPFSGEGDTRTPRTYASDATPVDTKYSAAGTTPFGKVSSTTYNVVPADLINKAYSPHGNLANNHGGYATSGAWTDRYGATSGTAARTAVTNVACLDCHNSHGSGVTGGTSYVSPAASYTAATSAPGNGGILKDTTAYTPSASTTAGNLYSAQADLCFDCHLGDDATAPRKFTNYRSPAPTQPVQGYYDANGLAGATRWGTSQTWTGSFAYKAAVFKGGHFGASTTTASGTSAPMKSTPAGRILGLCTMCHDPHGVDPAATNAAYRVPALKGTWMTSPYKEDRAGDRVSATLNDTNTWSPSGSGRFTGSPKAYSAPRQNPSFAYNQPAIVGGGYGTGISTSTWGKGGTGFNGYFIDDNSFGNSKINDTTYRPWSTTITGTYVTTAVPGLSDTLFAGLCLNCHLKTGALTAGGIGSVLTSTNGPYTYDYSGRANNTAYTKTVTGINDTITVHRTVLGWDTIATAANLFKYYMTRQHAMVWNGGGGQSVRSISSYTTGPGAYRWSVNPGTTTHADTWNPYTDTAYDTGNYTLAAGGQQSANYTDNTYHRFVCSKCHTPHVARLPRLMKTNCLDVGPSATQATSINKHGSTSTAYSGTGYTFGAQIADTDSAGNSYMPNERPMHCHNQKKSNKPSSGGWNTVTGWP